MILLKLVKCALVKLSWMCTIFSLSFTAGMRLAEVSDISLEARLSSLLQRFGLLFQSQDDFLDCFGDVDVTGKHTNSFTLRLALLLLSTSSLFICRSVDSSSFCRAVFLCFSFTSMTLLSVNLSVNLFCQSICQSDYLPICFCQTVNL